MGSEQGSKFRTVEGVAWGLAAALLTAGWWVVTRHGVTTSLDPFDLAALRFGASGLLLAPVLWRDRAAVLRLHPARLALMVLCAGAPYSLATGTALRLATAGGGGALVAGLLPLFGALLSGLVLKERIGPARRAGLALIVCGALALGAGGAVAGVALPLFVLASLMWAAFTLALRQSGLAPLTAIGVVCVASSLAYVPGYLLLDGGAAIRAAPLSEIVPHAVYQGFVSAILAVFCFARAVLLLGASRAALFGALVPVASSLLGAAVLAELPGPRDVAGIVVMVCGTALASGAVPHRRSRAAGRVTGSGPRPPGAGRAAG